MNYYDVGQILANTLYGIMNNEVLYRKKEKHQTLGWRDEILPAGGSKHLQVKQ